MTMAQRISATTRNEQLAAIAQQVAACPRCPALVVDRTHAVFGSGNPAAQIMLVGEAPGRNEDLEGQPFVGASGRLLTDILAKVGLTREEVFITNVVKCRPPGNRKPLPTEAANCREYLVGQIALIRPRVLVALGATAAAALIASPLAIGKLRGTVQQYEEIPVVCTYHPAYVFRNRAMAAEIQADLEIALQYARGGI